MTILWIRTDEHLPHLTNPCAGDIRRPADRSRNGPVAVAGVPAGLGIQAVRQHNILITIGAAAEERDRGSVRRRRSTGGTRSRGPQKFDSDVVMTGGVRGKCREAVPQPVYRFRRVLDAAGQGSDAQMEGFGVSTYRF